MKSDDTLIRRQNLRKLMAIRQWAVADLNGNLGWGRYTYWRDLLENPDKSFGEKVARKIEEAAKDVPRGWLDMDHSASDQPISVQAPRSGNAPPPVPDFKSRDVSDSEYSLLQDLRTLPEEEIAALRARAAKNREHVDRIIAQRQAAALREHTGAGTAAKPRKTK